MLSQFVKEQVTTAFHSCTISDQLNLRNFHVQYQQLLAILSQRAARLRAVIIGERSQVRPDIGAIKYEDAYWKMQLKLFPPLKEAACISIALSINATCTFYFLDSFKGACQCKY